ncbi:MAG: alanine racemase [Oscillatoriales cyanobacterium RM2_1_1]|nr:alanine racemase [Oscillatoriales cyanobacterium SM2_3_0]NJO46594.1 alanine racemase [Oscillatoriales cyanobacterium RM2_1_1]
MTTEFLEGDRLSLALRGREAYGGIHQRAWVEVDLGAITTNVQQIQTLLAPQTELMAVVKADAYGHGATFVAQVLSQAGVSGFAVATIPEGIELREAGIDQPILVLGAAHTPDEVKAIAHWQLQATLCTPQQALLFSASLSRLNQSLAVQLNLDTGMSRLGTDWQQAIEFVELVQRLPRLKIAGVYSHFATADDPDPTVLQQQHQRFQQAIAQLRAMGYWDWQTSPSLAPLSGSKGEVPPIPGSSQSPRPLLHIANSAATLMDTALHYDLVRVGLAIYGLYPAPHLQSCLKLKSALQVKARITQIKKIEPGTGISYGHRFVAQSPMQIAVVGIGYADGVPRNLSNQMQVLVQGEFAPQVGAITMDQLMIDVSHLPSLRVGEVVTLIGQEGDRAISAEDWAARLGTISWEILCGFKHRLPRIATVN